MNLKKLFWTLTLFTLAIISGAHAAIVTPVKGSFYTPHGGTPATVTGTSRSAYVSSDVSSPDVDLLKRGVITLGIDHHHTTAVAEHHTVVDLSIKKWVTLAGGYTTVTTSLDIDYKPNTQLEFNDAKLFEVDNVLKYEVTITGVTVNGVSQTTLPANVFVNLDLFVNRLYDFTSEVNSTVNLDAFDSEKLIDKNCDGKADELLVQWDRIDGAEEYQLEWTFINDYTAVDGDFKDEEDIAFDFKRNSTRILTVADNYSISLIYPHGYIVYRVRAVGRLASDPTKRVYTKWSTQDEGTIINSNSSLDANDYCPVVDEWEVSKNWQYSASFAEEGKKKEVVSFFDGSLRNRQMVTVMNSKANNKAIVGETIYDHIGRPAVQVLPVPVPNCTTSGSSGVLKYYPEFNLNTSEEVYSGLDLVGTTTCEVGTEAMSTSSGASQYYSSENPDRLVGQNGYIPDAELYPFSQVEYTPDNTGRIKRQGGVGAEFQLGSDHESKYYYAHPSQLELDRMFGVEVGDAAHYQKNMVMDPNGQVSVSYLDQEGRVIATSLAGAAASNTKALDSQSGANVTLNEALFTSSSQGNVTSQDGMSKTFNATIAVSASTDMTFNYDLDITKFQDECLNEGICFGCVYDLSIDVTNDCGVSMVPSPGYNAIVTGHFVETETHQVQFILDCENSEVNHMPLSFTIEDMPVGTYQVSKTLRINEAALDYYQQQMQNPEVNTCFQTLEDFQQQYLSAMDFSDCVSDPMDCEECKAKLGTETSFIANGYGTATDYAFLVEKCELPCKPKSIGEATRNLLLNDVKPNGQYGEYLSGGQVLPQNFPLSVYNKDNDLPRAHYTGATTLYDWQAPVYEDGLTTTYKYYEEDLVTESKVQLFDVVLDGSGNITSSSPEVLVGTGGSFTHDVPTDTYWTAPENLSDVADFIANFKPSWAYSLIYYHPEYNYLKTYLEFGEYDGPMSSDSFDQKMEQAETWQDAIDAGLIKSNYATCSTCTTAVEDRLQPYTFKPTPNTDYSYDPFTVSAFATSQGWNPFSADFVAELANYNGTGYHITEIAAMMARCGTIGSTPTTDCYKFGEDASGSGVGGSLQQDIDARNADWVNFKSLYRSLKQQYQAKLALYRAINESAYYGYNACIGNLDFSPYANDFFHPPFAGGQYLNAEQPCWLATAELYKYKQRRFISPGTSGATGELLSVTDPNAGLNEFGYTAYNLTGNCPVSIGLAQLVDNLIETDHIDDASYSLLLAEQFAALLVSQGLVTNPPSTLPSWDWEATVSGATLSASIMNGTTTVETIEFVQQTLTPVLWSTVDEFNHFQATGTGGLGFEFSAEIISGTDTIEVLGSTSIDILNCSFPLPCTMTSLGSDLYDILNVMTTNTIASTSPVTIYGSGAGTLINSMMTESILDQMNVTTNPSTVYWTYNSTTTAFEISASSSNTIKLDIVNKVPSTFTAFGSINYFSDLEVVDENTIVVHGFNSSDVEIVALTLDALLYNGTSDAPLDIASCEQTPMGCDDIAVVNVSELEALLNDVLANQNDPFDLFASSYMTSGLIAQFEQGLTSTSSTTTETFVYDDGYSLGTTLISQNVTTSGSTVTTVTVYQTVTATLIKTYTETVVCRDGLGCTTSLDSLLTTRTFAKVDQTVISIGSGCELVLSMDEDQVHGSTIDDILGVIDLIPTGDPDFDGNYHEFDLVVSLPFSATDTLHGSICLPLRNCEELEPFVFPTSELPTAEYTNPCVEATINLALSNAEIAYNNYLDEMLTEFRSDYIRHCMSGLESFKRIYDQREYHHTLYYYDQAGNLIKTIPPEGVELLPITSSSDALSVSIANDRTNGTQTVITSHRMETRYLYNSLNQLIAQHMPDQEDMSSWSQSLPNGLDVNLSTTGIQMLDASIGYLTGFVTTSNSPTGSRGYLYKTTDGGLNWTRITNMFAYDLLRVKMASSTTGFAVGKSGVALRTLDGGATWDLLNMHSKGVVGDFVDVSFQDASNAAFLMANGHIVPYISGALGNEYTPSAPSSSTGSPTLRAGYSINYNGTSNVYAVNLDFVEGTSPDTIRFTQIALVNISTPSTSYETVNGVQWNALTYVSSAVGFVAGPDGDLVMLSESGSNGTGTAFMQSANSVASILDISFVDKKFGVAILNESGSKYFCKTIDGGINWTKVSNNTVNSMGVIKQSSTDFNVLVSFTSGSVVHYNITTSTNTTKWTQSTGTSFHKLAGYADGTNYYYFAAESTLKLQKSTAFTLTATTAPSFGGSAYATLSGGTAVSVLRTKVISSYVHVFAVMSNGVVWDAGGTTTATSSSPFQISGSTAKYVDVAVGSNGGDYVLGYEWVDQKLYRLSITNSMPSTTMTAISASASTLPANSNINAMALHGDFVTLIASTGKIYSSTTIVTKTSSANLSYADRSDLRVLPIRSSSRISFTNSSINYTAIAVGDRNVVLRKNSSNVWMVTPMGLMVTIPALSYTYAPSLKSVATAVVSSTNYAILVGDEALRYRLNLNTGTLTALTTATYPTSGAPVYTDAAINTSGNTVLTSADGKAFYCSNVHTGTTFTQISTTASSLYGASMVPSASTAIVVGNSGIIGTLSSTLFTQQTGIYGPKLNSVHFSSTSMGTVVGDNFFVRATSNSGTNWSRVLPFTVNPTNLIVNVTDVWTRPTNTSAHYALLGGASYLSYCLGNVATPDGTFNALGLTVNDIQFSTYSPNTGYIAAGTSLKKIQLTVSGGTYTTSITSPLSAALPTTINAIHVFTHGSNTSELMLVGNNMIRYKEEGASTTTSLLGGAAGNIRAVVFTDMDHGYVAGDAGLFYETDVITYNTSGSAYTAMSWMQHNVNDAYTGSATNMNITSLEFPTATRGIWGGNYTTSPGSAYAAVRVLNVEDQNYSSRFYYDRLGRIVVSQNSRQKGESKYSYTLYDGLGRVVEAGEKTENTAGGGATFFASIFGTSVGGQYITSVIDDTKLNNWITTQSTTTRKEVTKSYYDLTNASIDGNGLSTYDANFFDKPTQRKRIVHVTYEETYDNSDATYDHATHYNYDIHGNVVKLLQDNKKMGALTSLSTQRFKKMNYVFDLISGNVIRVDYEHGDADQWHHAYVYDADNRITDVYTTTATPLFATSNAPLEVRTEPMSSPYWYKEANYRYYDHGPLMRTELSEEQVQGLDYVYTLQGWIKGVNSNTLDVTRDPGADGATSGSAMRVARDVMGYSLHYYTDDYLPITTGNATFNASQSSSDLVNTSNSKDMFNGNIARMVTTITHPDTRAVLPLGNAYRYDQLNRLTDAVSFTNLNTSANTWGSGGTGIYQNNFTYDANGNILTQVRKNETGATIDDLQYKYQKNSAGKTIRNRLYHVDDNTASGTYSDDIDDMGTFADGATINSANNYAYDAEGRLIKDVQEQIASIVWRVDGKVKEINRTSGSSKKNLKFDYDAMGHRIAKHVLTSANVLEKSTYYILDAQGNTIATYERAIEAGTGTVTFAQKEKFIYGSARLGVLNDDIALYGSQNATYSQATWTHIIGKRNYELSNHLGNVLSVISDKPMPVDDAADGDVDWFLADIRQSTDYSAFGVQLSGRNLYKTGAKKSRFGMNGMEVDDEIKGGGNSYDFGARMLDPRLGRWLTIDPMSSKHPNNSPYLFCNANPILFKDPDGKDFIITIIQEPGRNEIIVSTVAHAYGHLAEQLVENFNIKNPDGVFSRSGSYIDADGINWTITVQIEIVVDHSLDEIGSPIDGGNTTANENWYEDLKTASPNFPKGHVTVNTEYIPPATILEYGAMGNDWTGATYYSSVMHGIFHNLGADDHYSWEGDLSSRIVDQYSYIYDQHFKMLGSALLEYDAKLNKYDRSKAGYRDFVVRPIDVGMYQSKSNTFACSPSIPWSTASWPEIYQEQFNRFLKYNPEGFRLPENTCDGKKENYTEVSHGQEVIFSN